MNLEVAYEDFLLAAAADGLSGNTVKWYRLMLKQFVAYFPSVDVAEITTPMIRQFIVSLRSRQSRYSQAPQRPAMKGGLSEDSIRGHIRALHKFWSWVVNEYRLPFNPMQNIKRPKATGQRQPKAADLNDIKRLMEATGDGIEGVRDRALLAFMLDTGCRVQGVVGLLDADLNLVERQALVTEKGSKTRPVFFIATTATLLEKWLAVRPGNATTVFCNLASYPGQPLQTSGVYQILKRLKKKAGITGRVNPHAFRHTFAREFLKNGGDLATLKALMGHTDIWVTAHHYAVFVTNELAGSHDKFSPVDQVVDDDSLGD